MIPFIRAAAAVAAVLPSAVAALAQEETPVAEGGVAVVEAASKTVSLIVWVLILLILLPVAFLVYRKVYRAMTAAGESKEEAPVDPAEAARRLELKGDFAGAGAIHEGTGNLVVAAALYVKAKDFARAAEAYEAVGDYEQAIAFHLKSGGSLKAAGLYVRMGNFLEAAKIFRNKGDYLRAGQALEKFGNRLAAARAYETAGEFGRAARLLREEGLHDEAADAWGKSLPGGPLTREGIEGWYTWAVFLLAAGRSDEARGILEQILAVNPNHAKSRDHLALLASPAPAVGAPEEPRDREAATEASAGREIDESTAIAAESADPMRSLTLRHMTSRTRFEPRYSMRLWLQMLRALAESHRAGVFLGVITPECISVDMTNAVTIVPAAVPDPAYRAPEVAAGAQPDEAADIWAMGCILYEMLAGGREGMGTKRPSEVRDDVPSWLDDLVMKCLARDRAARYRSLEELSAAIVALKAGA